MANEVREFFENWRDSDLPLGRKTLKASLNLAKRLRGKPCCGHPGEPGC